MNQVLRAVSIAITIAVLAAFSGPREVTIHTVARARLTGQPPTGMADLTPMVMPELVGAVGYADATARLDEIGCGPPEAKFVATGSKRRTVTQQRPAAGVAVWALEGKCVDRSGSPVVIAIVTP